MMATEPNQVTLDEVKQAIFRALIAQAVGLSSSANWSTKEVMEQTSGVRNLAEAYAHIYSGLPSGASRKT
jgi:hypothetical protein